MDKVVTVAGEVIGGPEYEETEFGKRAWLAISVVTKRRSGDEWVDDPPVVYHVVARDPESMGVAASVGQHSRILVSGVVRGDQPLIIEADDIVVSVNRHGRS